MLYIFWFLHQTTTRGLPENCLPSCIPFDSYIKPQLVNLTSILAMCCISFDSYIKPQLWWVQVSVNQVVYLLIPTSNHNCHCPQFLGFELYIFWFLHQTTTDPELLAINNELYIFWFLHQTTTTKDKVADVRMLYIFWFLHQTTTIGQRLILVDGLYIFWFLHQTTTWLRLPLLR